MLIAGFIRRLHDCQTIKFLSSSEFVSDQIQCDHLLIFSISLYALMHSLSIYIYVPSSFFFAALLYSCSASRQLGLDEEDACRSLRGAALTACLHSSPGVPVLQARALERAQEDFNQILTAKYVTFDQLRRVVFRRNSLQVWGYLRR